MIKSTVINAMPTLIIKKSQKHTHTLLLLRIIIYVYIYKILGL